LVATEGNPEGRPAACTRKKWNRRVRASILPDMKRLAILGLFLAWGGLALGADKFWQQLTPEERQAAGVDQLSPEQRAALDRLAERFASEGARQAVAVAKTETRAKVEKEMKKREEARVGLPNPKEAMELIETRIAGTFNGWSGQTVFHLENGQTWMQSDKSDLYWVPTQPGPEVEVRRSSIGGWKLSLSNGRWVRVKRVH
jgi:hypothetical protein